MPIDVYLVHCFGVHVHIGVGVIVYSYVQGITRTSSGRMSKDKGSTLCFYVWVGRNRRPQNINTMNKRFILFVCLLCSFPLMADRLTVQHRYFGTDRTEDIAAIGKWVFVDDRVQLLDHNGYLFGEEYIGNIVKITFSNTPPVPTSTDEAQSGTVIVYPNPTHEMLCVQGVPDDITLRVYSTTGQLLTTAQGTKIDVSHLPQGTYLLQLGAQVIRFVKE